MVEDRASKSPLQTALHNWKGMLIGELIPLIHFKDLVECARVCKGFRNLIDPSCKNSINVVNLFKAQGQKVNDTVWSLLASC